MILRKPFAFLIKHFKLIHFILFIFMGYIMYSSSTILSFYNEYLSSTLVLINHDVLTTLYTNFFTISFFFIFLITIIILSLMFIKKKPIKFYIFNLIVYIFTLVVLVISKNTLSALEISLIEVKTIKLVQDFILITVIAQGIMCTVAAIRATGFNIKKFDFVKDLAELDIAEQDNEEFEVNVEIESDKYIRKFKRFTRYIKYIYVENKYLFSIISAILIALICFIVYINTNVYNKAYKEREAFQTNEFYFSVMDTYLTKKDYKGNIISEDYSFVLAKIKLRTYSKLERVLSLGRISLYVNEHNIYHTVQYKTEFSDLGNYYNEEKIGTEFQEYLLVFKIPNSYASEEMVMQYSDTNFKKITIKIDPEHLDDNPKEYTSMMGNKTIFKDSILGSSYILIENSEIAPSFTIPYNFCVSDSECMESYEVVKPILNTTSDKVLVKIKATFGMDQTLSINKMSQLFQLFEKFGTIVYTVGEKTYTVKNLTQVLPIKIVDNTTTYLEVPDAVLHASQVLLKFNIRNCTFVYTLK